MKGPRFKPIHPDSFRSEPNIITLVRLVSSVIFFVLAVATSKETYNFIGLGIHWVGDWLDGVVARVFKRETILGAEIDIIADRVESLFFFLVFLSFHPQLYIPVVLYIFDFAFVDFYLSYQFIKFDIISVNYFYKVDRTVFLLNFSRAGKIINSAVVTLLLIFLPDYPVIPSLLAVILIGIKGYSVWLLNKKRHLQKIPRS